MITIYYHCIGMTEADETFLKNSLQELAQRLKAEPIKLEINVRRLGDEPGLTEKVDGKLNRLSDPSYIFNLCAGQILCAFSEKGFVQGDVSPKLLVYCSKNSQVAKAALRQNPSAQWGATCGLLSTVYEPNNKFIIWHEALHLLGVDDCYDESDLHCRKPDCNCETCMMQYEPTEKTVGKWSLCEKNIKVLTDSCRKEKKTIRE